MHLSDDLLIKHSMPDKDPTTWTLATWALAGCAALLGGAIDWFARMKLQHPREFRMVEFVGEMVTSGTVGLLVFFALAGLDQPTSLCAVGASIGGHWGIRLLFMMERAAEHRLKALADIEDPPCSTCVADECVIADQMKRGGKGQS